MASFAKRLRIIIVFERISQVFFWIICYQRKGDLCGKVNEHRVDILGIRRGQVIGKIELGDGAAF